MRRHPKQVRDAAPVEERQSLLRGLSLDQRVPRSSVLVCDIFDTLVLRSVHPEDVKRLAADRIARYSGMGVSWQRLYGERAAIERSLCEQTARKGLDLEFRFGDFVSAFVTQIIAKGLVPSETDPSRLATIVEEAELEVERSVQFIDSTVANFLQRRRRDGARVVLLSDFYLEGPKLASLLRWHGLGDCFDEVVVSCDTGLSKRTGRAFSALCERLGEKPHNLVMLGDNPNSDGEMARQSGLASVVLDRAERESYYARETAAFGEKKRLLSALKVHPTHGAELPFARICFLLFYFVAELRDRLIRDGIRDVFFLSREGQPLKAMFDRYQELYAPSSGLSIRTHYLVVSRRSTFLPSLAEIGNEDFSGLFRQYVQLSVSDFLSSLGFSSDDIQEICRAIKLDACERHADFPGSVSFRLLLASGVFRDRYEARRIRQHAALSSYIRSFGVDLDRQPLALVDVGWKGSIQDYLHRALRPSSGSRGYYLGLLAPGSASAQNQKFGIAIEPGRSVDLLGRALRENTALLEIVLAADHGSAREYEFDEEGNGYPILDSTQDDWQGATSHVRSLLHATIRNIEGLSLSCSRFPVGHLLRRAVARAHFEMLLFPRKEELAWFSLAAHRENFGVFNMTSFSEATPLTWRARLRHVWDFMTGPRTYLAGSFWPRHRLAATGLGAFGWAYGRYVSFRSFWHRG